MKYAQIQLVLKVVLVKNNYIQKSDRWLIVELKRLDEQYIEMKEYGKKCKINHLSYQIYSS